MSGHLLDVNSARFIADGGAVLSASSDMSVRIWSASTGHCGAVLRGHTGGVLTAVPLGHGRTVVSGGRDCAIRSWEVATAKPVGAWHVGGTVRAAEQLGASTGASARAPVVLYGCESGGVTIESAAQLAALSAPAGVGAAEVLRSSRVRAAAASSSSSSSSSTPGAPSGRGSRASASASGARRWMGEGHVGIVDIRAPKVACRLLAPVTPAAAASAAGGRKRAGGAASGAGGPGEPDDAPAGVATESAQESFVAVGHASKAPTSACGPESGRSSSSSSSRSSSRRGEHSEFDVWGAAQSGKVFHWDLRVPSAALAVEESGGSAGGVGGGWGGGVGVEGTLAAGADRLRNAVPCSLRVLERPFGTEWGKASVGAGAGTGTGTGGGGAGAGALAVACSDGLVRVFPREQAVGGGAGPIESEVILTGLDLRAVGGQAWASVGRESLGVPSRRQMEAALEMARGSSEAGAKSAPTRSGADGEVTKGREDEEDEEELLCCATVSHSGVLGVYRGVRW